MIEYICPFVLLFLSLGMLQYKCLMEECEDLNSAGFLTFALTDFEDYGAYWRYNYETIEEDSKYRYTRDELMHDVRSVYNQVNYFVEQILIQHHV